MATLDLFISSLFFLLLSLVWISTGDEFCQNLCDGNLFGGNPVVRFPFQFETLNATNSRCGYPGFDLTCSKNGLTILTLPLVGQFFVEYIDYRSQAVWFSEPSYCLPKKFLDSPFNLSDTPFIEENRNPYFTFLNCSTINGSITPILSSESRPASCLSGENYTVFALPTGVYDSDGDVYPSCEVISKEAYVPVLWPRWTDISAGSRLLWVQPDCRGCEDAGGTCGFAGESGLDIGCSNPPKDGGKFLSFLFFNTL